MYEDDEEQEEGPKSSFSTYLAEGDVLFKQGAYKKALDSYSQALELKPTDRFCLVARSKCYLQLGDSEAALRDAESALEEDKEFTKGLYQKAEALYAVGDFELALMFYHRGKKLRPELDEFRLGIQKAQEAIDNSIGDAANVKLENKGDLSFFAKQDEMKKPKGYSKPKTQASRNQQQLSNRGKQSEVNEADQKTVKQLLGELYADKDYLEKIVNGETATKHVSNQTSDKIHQCAVSALQYFDDRTNFWLQQRSSSRRKKQRGRPVRLPKPKGRKPAETTRYILRSLEEIDNALADGDPKGSLKQAQSTLKTVESLDNESCPNKEDVLGNLHSCIGNAYLELDEDKMALEHHQKDLTISQKSENDDGRSRALDNLGRTYAKMGEYGAAIDSWTNKLPLSRSALESTWLFHEIGRSHLELQNYQDAKEFGQRSLAAAHEAEDEVWELNATVLVAQSEVKLGDLEDALQSFEQALELARLLGDDAAESAISRAVRDINDRLAMGVKSKKDDKAKADQEDEGNDNTANQDDSNKQEINNDKQLINGDMSDAQEKQDSEKQEEDTTEVTTGENESNDTTAETQDNTELSQEAT